MRVVLAEDEPITRLDIKRLLEELGCQVVAQCSDGDSALIFTQKHRPNVVLMDIKMPDTDGLTATKLISRKGLAPVVLLTSYSDPETIEEAMESGALGYLLKPVDKKKLLPTLQIACQRFQELQKLSQEVEGLTATMADRPIILQAKDILRKIKGCSEDEAYHMLRSMSMEQHKSMELVAREILNKMK